MKKQLLLLIVLAGILQGKAQKTQLVDDFISGTADHIDGQIYKTGDKVIYFGADGDGRNDVYEYDAVSKSTNLLVDTSLIDGDVTNLIVGHDRILILTWLGFGEGQIFYEVTDPETFDGETLYSIEGNIITSLGLSEEYLLLMEYDQVNNDTSIKVVDRSGDVFVVTDPLPGIFSEYRMWLTDEYALVYSPARQIDGKNLLVYDLSDHNLIPVEEAFPNYVDCGLISNINLRFNATLSISCEEGDLVYDVAGQKYLDYDFGLHLIQFFSDEYIVFAADGANYIYDRTTDNVEVLFDGYQITRADSEVLLSLYDDTENSIIRSYSFSTQISQEYVLEGINANEVIRIGPYLHREGKVYLFVTLNWPQGSYLIEIGEDLNVLDSLPGTTELSSNFIAGPLLIHDEIYFSYEDPEYGRELFKYSITTSTDDVDSVLSALEIFPNPTSDQLTITSDSKIEHVTLSAVNGQIVKIEDTGLIDMSYLPTGPYVALVTFADGRLASRIVVKR